MDSIPKKILNKNNNQYNFLNNDDPEVTVFNKSSFEIENNPQDQVGRLNTEQNNILNDEKKEYNEEEEIIDDSKCGKFKKMLKCINKKLNKCFCNKYIQALYGVILTISWIVLYLFSLMGCHKQQAECLTEFNHSTVKHLGIILLASTITFFILCLFAFFKFTHRAFLFISLAIMIYLFYFYDIGADFAFHGSYNRVFFYTFYIILLFLFLTISIIFIGLYKHPLKTIAAIIILSSLFYLQIYSHIHSSCDYWMKGFKNSRIRNDIGYCQINPPGDICFLKATDNLFDVSAIRGMSCANDRDSSEEHSLLKKYLPENFKNAKRIGFPRTETWKFFPDSTLYYFVKNIFKSMVDMDDREILTENKTFSEKNKVIDDTEVYIDFNKKYPEVIIELKKNETLIKEREKILAKNPKQPLFKNVIFIYLDALARNHFRRKLKKTFAWLEKFYDNTQWDDFGKVPKEKRQPKKPKDDVTSRYNSYQFLKYQSVDYYTFANMIPGYFGVHKWDEYGKYFLYDYKEAGFITGQSTNVCEREGWDLENAFEPYLNYTNYDHEFNSFFCDPTFSDPDLPYQFMKGAYSVIRKCMYGKDSGQYQIDYAKQFFDTYKDQNKVYRMIFSDAHEGTLEVVKYLDDMLSEYFEYLLVNGHLENSILLVMSDHGISLPGPAYLTRAKDWYSEVYLPSLFFLIDNKHVEFNEIHETLNANENKWITSFDINSSLRSFANRTNTNAKYGQSIVKEVIDEDYRSCGYYRITNGCLCGYKP